MLYLRRPLAEFQHEIVPALLAAYARLYRPAHASAFESVAAHLVLEAGHENPAHFAFFAIRPLLNHAAPH